VVATDSSGASASRSVTVLINPGVAIITIGLSAWTAGLSGYNQTIIATGGTGTITFNGSGGTFPTGLTLSSAGVLSGTPSSPGMFSFTVLASDLLGVSTTQNYTVTINPVLSLSSTTLPAWTANQGYTQSIKAAGGTGTLTFSTTGTLPTGLTLSATGTMSGTPTVPGSYPFSVTITDMVGASITASYTVVINPVPAITTTALPGGALGQPYNQPILLSGGTAPYTFGVTGSLPSGVILNSGGMLTGTPSGTGTYSFTVSVTDNAGASASASYSVYISPIAISPLTLASWSVNLPG
jgi:hypothetical protein